jgi:hypothetical protein
MFLLDRLLKLKDMGGRRLQHADRRKAVSPDEISDRRQKNRRSGFDRRGIFSCTIRDRRERRKAFRDLPN